MIEKNFDDVCCLIKATYGEDEIGQNVEKKTFRQVFCKISDISQKEFFAARQGGFTPELKISMWKDDYCNEAFVSVNKTIYRIYRKQIFEDEISLYCESRLDENG